MNLNTYHFENARLNDSAQTRISSNSNTPGFSSKEDLILFLKKISFSYTITFYDKDGKRNIIEKIK